LFTVAPSLELPATVTAPPVGAVASRTSEKLVVAVPPEPFVAVTVCEPLALELDHVYVALYGALVSSPPPLKPEGDGKLTAAIPDSASATFGAETVIEPAPAVPL
jgi:hypothetical protein